MEAISGLDTWKTRLPDEEEHLPTCPCHEDNHDGEAAVCTCPSPEDLKAQAEEDRFDAQREGGV